MAKPIQKPPSKLAGAMPSIKSSLLSKGTKKK